jgi:molybdopterin/thiamine biosynthesis adenylyltransferase
MIVKQLSEICDMNKCFLHNENVYEILYEYDTISDDLKDIRYRIHINEGCDYDYVECDELTSILDDKVKLLRS